MELERFETVHTFMGADARDLNAIGDGSIGLAVTSPPYPMISMWDSLFADLSAGAAKALAEGDGTGAFEFMHLELDRVWRELYRVLGDGAIACINIGDATRTVDGRFRLFPNHSRIIAGCCAAGFDVLPMIIWSKQTNAPNKFMGSGMLPAGAYVTLEHEYVLLFRKGVKREFPSEALKKRRRESALFWEERNSWFSETWDFKGTPQRMPAGGARERSAAFPFEMAYRLINMYSLYGDRVLDPFAGTGTTMLAAAACGRSSTGADIEAAFRELIDERFRGLIPEANRLVENRIECHLRFIEERSAIKGTPRHLNSPHGFGVMTGQETELRLRRVERMARQGPGSYRVSYGSIGADIRPDGKWKTGGTGEERGAVVQCSLDIQ